MCAVACGGAQSDVHTPHPETTASASASQSAPPPAAASIVHFDDLGITFAVPPDFHVIGDAELAARIGASATPHLQSDLRKRAEAKKGIPLLALSKGDLNVTLSVVVVPADALPLELAQHQQEVMSANVAGFEVTSAPKDRAQDGVPGAEMSTRYLLDHPRDSAGAVDKVRVASRMRLFVRDGIATLVTAVWPESAAHADDASALLDGLRFQPTH